jgi:hypothetical protein
VKDDQQHHIRNALLGYYWERKKVLGAIKAMDGHMERIEEAVRDKSDDEANTGAGKARRGFKAWLFRRAKNK